MNPNLLMNPLFLFVLSFAVGLMSVSGQSSPRVFSEPHVVRSLRQIHSAQMTYQATTGAGSFGSLQNLHQAGLIDEALASASKYGYSYALLITSNPSAFVVNAVPRAYRKTGVRSFYVDRFGEIHGADRNGQPATVSDPIIDDCTNGGISDNERCTIMDMRSLHSAQMTFAATVGGGDYGTFQQLYAAGLIRSGLALGRSRGYNFQYLLLDNNPPTNPASFKIWATPRTYGTTAIRSFFIDQTGVLRGADRNGGQADQNDPPINE